MSSSATGKDVCQWPSEHTDELLEILLEFYRQGKSTGKSLTESVRQEVLSELNTRTGVSYSATQLMDEYKRLKKKWSMFRILINETGGGWSSQRRTVDLPPSKLDDFKPFQENGLERYEDMNEMWTKGTATGSFARSSSNAHTSAIEEKEHMCKEFARASGTSRRCKSSYTVKMNERRCKSRFSVKRNEGQCNMTHSDSSIWSVERCVGDVGQMAGATTMHIENARKQFGDRGLRTTYMHFKEEERRIWVFKYCIGSVDRSKNNN